MVWNGMHRYLCWAQFVFSAVINSKIDDNNVRFRGAAASRVFLRTSTHIRLANQQHHIRNANIFIRHRCTQFNSLEQSLKIYEVQTYRALCTRRTHSKTKTRKKWPREFSRTINSYIRKLLITYHESQWYLYSQITFQMAITIEWRISHENGKFLRLKWIYMQEIQALSTFHFQDPFFEFAFSDTLFDDSDSTSFHEY